MSVHENSITFVCTANMCRSPIAEFVFNRESTGWLNECGLELTVNSRGTHAEPGDTRCEVASKTFEILDSGVSAQFQIDDPNVHGLVLTMEQMHMRHLVQAFPKLRSRIFSLAQAVEITAKIYDGIVDGSLFTSPDPEVSVGFVAPPFPEGINDRWQWLVSELDANRGLISTTNSILTSGDYDIGDAHVPDGPTHELSLDLVAENAIEFSENIRLILTYEAPSALASSVSQVADA